MNVLQEVTVFRTSSPAIANAKPVLTFSISNSNPSTSKMVVPTRNGKYDWYAMLPSLETLRNREHFRSKPSSNQRKSYIMDVMGRKVTFSEMNSLYVIRLAQKSLI